MYTMASPRTVANTNNFKGRQAWDQTWNFRIYEVIMIIILSEKQGEKVRYNHSDVLLLPKKP